MKRMAGIGFLALLVCSMFAGPEYKAEEVREFADDWRYNPDASGGTYPYDSPEVNDDIVWYSGVLIRGPEEGKDPDPAPQPPRLRCTTILVGKHASAPYPNWSVLLAHNEDLGDSAAQHYFVVPRLSHSAGETVTLWSGATVPQAAETFAYSGTKVYDPNLVPGDLTSGTNEYQVSVVNNLAYQRDAVTPAPTNGRILWSELSRFALERAKTAREAVELMGSLAQTYKLASDPGTMFGVTDPEEAWWIEIGQEGQWIARRVRDDAFEMRANAYRIGKVNLNDSANILHSPDIVSYARERGWFAGDDASFDFAKAYGDPVASAAAWNTHREERVKSLLSGMVGLIQVGNLMGVLSDHYEGTPYDLTQGYKLGSPHKTSEYTICNSNTEVSVVIQSRSWLPREIGTVSWRSMATPCSGVFLPWYPEHQRVPAEYEQGTNVYSPDSAYWVFRRLSEYVDAQYGQRIGAVSEGWNPLREKAYGDQYVVEDSLRALYFYSPRLARFVLTAYSNALAERALEQARAWLETVGQGRGASQGSRR